MVVNTCCVTSRIIFLNIFHLNSVIARYADDDWWEDTQRFPP